MNFLLKRHDWPVRTAGFALWAGRAQCPTRCFCDNPLLPTLLAHKSVRHYKPDPLPPGTLEMLGAAAQSAASSSNLQTWSVIAVQDPARKAKRPACAAIRILSGRLRCF